MLAEDRYLVVTYRHGKAMAAYLHFPDMQSERAARTRKMGPDLVVDFAADGRPIGLEIISPATVTLQDVNEVLRSLNKEAMPEEELAPLKAG